MGTIHYGVNESFIYELGTTLWNYNLDVIKCDLSISHIKEVLDKLLKWQRWNLNLSRKDSRMATHLLFAANMIGAKHNVENALKEGTTIILDHYMYFEVAYTMARLERGIGHPNIKWCQIIERGILPSLLYVNVFRLLMS